MSLSRRFRYVSVEQEAPTLLRQWQRLRGSLYLDSGFISTENLDVSGAYSDHYDDYSEHVLMYDEDDPSRPIGTCRIIDGRRGLLQVEEQFGVSRSVQSLEVSGFAVVPEYRKTFVTLGCYWLIFRRAVEGHYDEIHFEVEGPLMVALTDLGLPFEARAKPLFVFNTWNTPVCAPTADVVTSLRSADIRRGGATRFASLFDRPYDGRLDVDDLFAVPEPGEAVV